MHGNTYGVEAWGTLQLTPAWRISPGVRTLQKRLRFNGALAGLVGVEIPDNVPRRQASLKSSFDFARLITLEAMLRYVSELPEPLSPTYTEFAARLAWRPSDAVEVAISGFNLLHDRHRE